MEEDKQEHAKKIFEKWDLDFVVIGKTTNSKKLILKFDDKEVVNKSYPKFWEDFDRLSKNNN